jgi:hypothetical protein
MCMFPMLSNRRNGRSELAGRTRIGCVVFLTVVIVLLGLLLLALMYRDKWVAARQGLVLVDKHVQSPRWSKDGRTLFYIDPKGRETLRAYDVNTGRNRGCGVSVGEPYDVSPDGKSVVYLYCPWRKDHTEYRVIVTSLDTRCKKIIYKTKKEIRDVYWFPGSVGIVFQPEGSGMLMTDSSGRIIREMKNKHINLGYAAYGSGVIYVGKDKSYRYHNIETGEDLHLRTVGSDENRCYYLSDRFLIYSIYNLPLGDARILDIRTGRARVIRRMLAFDSNVAISPDVSRYSLWMGGIGESAVPKLYVGTFSKRVTKELADFGCAGDNSRHSAERSVYHP